VGIDHPDDAGLPPDEHSDHRANRADRAERAEGSHGGVQVETRYRQEYYDDLRAAVSTEEKPRQPTEEDRAKADGWAETAELSRWMWTEYRRRWPPEERPPVDRSGDPPGSWRAEGDRFFDRPVNQRIEGACDRVEEREQERISPTLRDTESQDQDRHLIGFEHRLKGSDRIKEKVYDVIEEFNFSPEEAVSLVPDAIRYTLQYDEARYTQGVRMDIARLKDKGFELDKLKNSWSDEQYKGINSQWIDEDTGQRFEVQFHTRISFEAKQLTHGAYERLRTHQADEFEELVLEAFQKKVTAEVPVPLGAADIPDYPKRGTDAR
jgi:hypothetical protein